MILLYRTTQVGELLPLGIPALAIQEVSPHVENNELSWIKYWVGNDSRSTVVKGKVEHIVQAINQAKAAK